MGYTTDFRGFFACSKALTPEQNKYLQNFADTRRMKRDADKAAELLDEVRSAVGLPIGLDGGYFVGGNGDFGQDQDESVIEYNLPPTEQPGLWCQWVPSEDGTQIVWDGGEKFYHYVEWIEYIIQHFLQPWGITLNGTVEWRGEDWDDTGFIVINNNEVEVRQRD